MRTKACVILWLLIFPLSVTSAIAASATLSWTAPGNDGVIGQATTYDIRYSAAPISEANWALATPVPNPPTPKAAGNREVFQVTGLLGSTTYYFALKAADARPNWSPLSNNAVKTTCPGACVGRTGNVNGSIDGYVDLHDLTLLVAYLSSSQASAPYTICVEEANVDGSADGVVSLSDLSRMVAYLTTGLPLANCP
jgi:hypothetical protein